MLQTNPMSFIQNLFEDIQPQSRTLKKGLTKYLSHPQHFKTSRIKRAWMKLLFKRTCSNTTSLIKRCICGLEWHKLSIYESHKKKKQSNDKYKINFSKKKLRHFRNLLNLSIWLPTKLDLKPLHLTSYKTIQVRTKITLLK